MPPGKHKRYILVYTFWLGLFIVLPEVVDNLVNGSIEICGDPPNPNRIIRFSENLSC
jgi:hypothetical protein